MTSIKRNIIILLLSVIFLSACSYSFTGASVPPHLETIAIPYAVDRTPNNVSDDFTNELVTKFIQDNSLVIAERNNADALLECVVTNIREAPDVISAGEDISQMKLTVTVKVVYRDLVMKKIVFNKSFSNYGQYSNEGDITQARLDALSVAIDNITEDILLAVVSNW